MTRNLLTIDLTAVAANKSTLTIRAGPATPHQVVTVVGSYYSRCSCAFRMFASDDARCEIVLYS